MLPSTLAGSPAVPVPAATWPGRLRQWLRQPANQLLLLLLLAALPLYYQLGTTPVQLWDESRVAVNTAEMARDGHWLVPHYNGQPDHWNTKPPLLIWLEALSFKAFGFSALALRLPTLVATLTTLLLLFRFATRVLGRPLAGLFAGMVLVTCTGYLRLHVARTGDYDALLCCWQVLLWTSFFEYLEDGQRRHLLWAAGAVLGATLTKGPAALLGLPGLLAYTLGRGKLGWLLRQPGVYAAAAGWLAVMAAYFVGREAIDPGYWRAVQENDLGGRYFTVLENHTAPWTYYLNNFVSRFFSPWLWAILPAVLLGWLQPPGPTRRVTSLLLAFVVGWLVVISTAKSKLEWYDAPIYPALALLLGLGLSIVYQDFSRLYLPRFGRWGGWAFGLLFGLTVFSTGYTTVFNQLHDERHSDFGAGPDGYLGRYINQVQHAQPQLEEITLLNAGNYNAVLAYYKLQFEQTPGRKLLKASVRDAKKLPTGCTVVLCDPAYRPALDSVFRVVELHQDLPCQTLLLLPHQ